MKQILKGVSTIILTLAISLPVFAAEAEILGAGATFPYPLYSKMFDAYHKEKNVKVNYQAIGSGGGIRQITNKTVDFGASDAFMSDEKLANVSQKLLHIPTCLGAVVITYNLPGKPELKFSPEVISDIFLGKITRWNDSRIQELNPEVNIPDLGIAVVHRSDGSGTTFVFSDYLAKVSEEWKEKVGRGKSLQWPTGLGAKGNMGVAGMIQQVPGSIGYVELVYALQNDMPVSIIKNKSGNFIKPGLKATSFAAETEIPDDTRISLTDSAAREGYSISSFTWLLIYQEQGYDSRSRKAAFETVKLIDWMIHEGQRFAEELGYAALPKEAVLKAEEVLRSVTYKGEKLLG